MADVLQTSDFNRGYTKSGKKNDLEHYEERLSKRREKEKDEKKLNDFLNNSLRASDRLKALEKAKRMNYKINDAYIDEGCEDVSIDVAGLTDGLCNRKSIKASLSRSDLEWIQRYVRSDIFNSSYATCMALSEILKRYNCPPLTGSAEASAKLDAVSDHIKTSLSRSKESQYKFQMRELLQILSTPELQTLCHANDRCANIIDRNNRERKETNRLEPSVAGTSVDVLRQPKNGNRDQEPLPRAAVIPKSPQETMRVIRSPLSGCYAEIYPSNKGIPLMTVVLEKGSMPLGATVRNERDAVVVGRIVVGGVAHKSGLLKEGDELLSVNGIELTGKDVNEVSDMLAGMKGRLKFTVASSADENSTTSLAKPMQTINLSHLRSLFSYNPEDDMYIPCKDIGLRFDRGDILHVTNIQDPNWWQAYKDVDGAGNGSLGELAGLIPSPEYQYKRELMKKQLAGDSYSMDLYASARPSSSILCLKKNKKSQQATGNGGWQYNIDINGRSSNLNDSNALNGRKRKHAKKNNRTSYCPEDMELNQSDPDINTYEEVQMYLPQPHRRRPVVIVGQDLIGRYDLTKKLVDSDSEQYSLIRQHTTLEMRSGDYRQVTKEEFKHLLNQDEFIETASFEKNWYGVSKTEVKVVIDSGKTAVVALQPESLPAIRKTAFLPYVVFLSPPTKNEAINNLRQSIGEERLSNDDTYGIISRTKMIDIKFGHMFDSIVTIESLEVTMAAVTSLIRRLDRETQWVPSRWLATPRPQAYMP